MQDVLNKISDYVTDIRPLYLTCMTMYNAAPPRDKNFWTSSHKLQHWLPKIPTNVSIASFVAANNASMVNYLLGDHNYDDAIVAVSATTKERVAGILLSRYPTIKTFRHFSDAFHDNTAVTLTFKYMPHGCALNCFATFKYLNVVNKCILNDFDTNLITNQTLSMIVRNKDKNMLVLLISKGLDTRRLSRDYIIYDMTLETYDMTRLLFTYGATFKIEEETLHTISERVSSSQIQFHLKHSNIIKKYTYLRPSERIRKRVSFVLTYADDDTIAAVIKKKYVTTRDLIEFTPADYQIIKRFYQLSDEIIPSMSDIAVLNNDISYAEELILCGRHSIGEYRWYKVKKDINDWFLSWF